MPVFACRRIGVCLGAKITDKSLSVEDLLQLTEALPDALFLGHTTSRPSGNALALSTHADEQVLTRACDLAA